MKNKTTTYILIGGVLIVWGLIFYRIFSGLDSGTEEVVVLQKKRSTISKMKIEENIPILLGSYRDPFLGGTSRSTTQDNKSGKAVKGLNPKKEVSVTDWSFIDYIGIVLNKETKKLVGLVKISEKEYMVNEKEVIAGVTFLRRERDSIEVKYQGEKKWIKR